MGTMTQRGVALLRAPLGVVGLYLLITLPLFLVGGLTTRKMPVAGAHLVVAAAVLWWASREPDPGWTALWVALLAIPFLYAEVPWLNQTLTVGYHDALVRGWDVALMGSEPSRQMASWLPWRWLSEVLHLAYLSFYPLVYVPPIMLALRRRRHAFHGTVLALLLVGTACYLVFALLPVQGPRYFGPPEGVPDGPVRRLVLSVLESGSSRGAAFPSAHMALTTAQAIMALRYQRRVGWLVTVAAVGVGLGAVYGGFHYAIDVLTGAVVGGAGARLALALMEGADGD